MFVLPLSSYYWANSLVPPRGPRPIIEGFILSPKKNSSRIQICVGQHRGERKKRLLLVSVRKKLAIKSFRRQPQFAEQIAQFNPTQEKLAPISFNHSCAIEFSNLIEAPRERRTHSPQVICIDRDRSYSLFKAYCKALLNKQVCIEKQSRHHKSTCYCLLLVTSINEVYYAGKKASRKDHQKCLSGGLGLAKRFFLIMHT